MEDALTRLKAGILSFQKNTYAANAAIYKKAAENPQQPHTLMITCADSRIDVESLTDASPGQIFVMRNIGNIVPVFGEMLGGVSAVVEYAVSFLQVQHVVICGHSDCGAIKALLNPDSLDTLPTVRGWLRNARAALMDGPSKDTLQQLTKRNVLLQLQHLKTHPAVAEAMAKKKLTLSGWYYDIGTGEVRISEYPDETFVPVREA